MLAKQDASYRSTAKRIHTIYFLATPHRGSDSAQLLKNVLGVGGLTSHAYIADLERGSLTNQSINDDFRQYSGDVCLWSFYETRKTSIGMFNTLIVDRESATLGYREERQTPMDANHRSICKFDSPDDPNYRILYNSFAATIYNIEERLVQQKEKHKRDRLKDLEKYLGISEIPEKDLIAVQDTRSPGTCGWLTARERFMKWKDFSAEGPTVFWLRGQPAAGKSVLAGYIIDQLQKTSRHCSYFFFKHGDKSKAHLSTCIRSLALQMALGDPQIQEKILGMHDEDVKFDKDDVRSLWRRLFEFGIFPAASLGPGHFWVIDGLDECSSHSSTLSFLLAKLGESIPLRILITSRESSELEKQFSSIKDDRCYRERLLPSDTIADMRALIQTKAQALTVSDERDRSALAAKVLIKSRGCFLWSVLVLSRMASAHGKEEINRVLEDIPREMEPLYLRTLEMMSQTSRSKPLATAILAWSACAIRPLMMAELDGALRLDVQDEFPNLKESILGLCGQLVQVDKAGVVHMVHETAREFLLSKNLESEFAVNTLDAHTRLATTCLAFLVSKEMKPPRTRRQGSSANVTPQRPPFAAYACGAFSDHLARSNPNNTELFLLVDKFLKANILSWIEVVAQTQNLSPLIRTAKNLRKYLAAATAARSPIGREMQAMRSWAIDLVRIAAKFGDALLASPSAIHWVVLPFCPTESAIYKAVSPGRKMSVAGLSNPQWDDRLVCVNFHQGHTTAVCHGDELFAVALNTGLITLYHAASCQEYTVLEHGEAVRHLQFNAQMEILASAGRRILRLWNIRSGSLTHSFKVPQRLMCISFDGDILLAPTYTHHVAMWNVTEGLALPSRPWYDSADNDEQPGCSPCAVSISCGHKMLAVAYRGRPITLWDLEEDTFYGSCGKRPADGAVGPYLANDLVFNPNEDIPLLVVTYADGDIMLIEPFEDRTLARFRANSHTLAASPDGRLLVAADGFGTIQVYEFETLRPVYRIKLASCNIKRLSFSWDGLRFLDIRGSECNVWEPPVLLRDSGADGSSDSTPTNMSVDETVAVGYSVKISAMLVHPRGEFAICGKEDGSIMLYEMRDGTELRSLYQPKSQCLVRILAWWADRQALICIDASNIVTVWRLDKSPVDGWNIEKMLFQSRLDCGKAIVNILVNQVSGKFVLSTRETDHLWSIDGQGEQARMSPAHPGSRKWIDHPQSPEHLICIEGHVARVFTWSDWSETITVDLKVNHGANLGGLQVKNVIPCAAGGRLLVEYSDQEGHQATRDIQLLESSLFFLPDAPAPTTPNPSTLETYTDLVGKVVHVIGVSGEKFIFVDVNSWVCSADLQDPGATYLRHFFVPYDWFSTTRDMICAFIEMSSGKNIVFARHNVVIVKKGLEYSEPAGSTADDSEPYRHEFSNLSLGFHIS